VAAGSSGAKTFEDLRIFQEARWLTGKIWKITRNKPFSSDRVLINQLRRASLSIVSNIAEGFERGSRAEFGRFLNIAKGSCGEVRAQMLIASDLNYISKRECEEFCQTARHVSAGLSKLAFYLRGKLQKQKV
jgi:four helix bundle protein